MNEVLNDYLMCSLNCIGNTDTIEELTRLNVEEVVNKIYEMIARSMHFQVVRKRR